MQSWDEISPNTLAMAIPVIRIESNLNIQETSLSITLHLTLPPLVQI